ncbi:MAG: hypothetical protein WC823_00580 [Parcubacteria group bacterium]|jgi:hypothetical protein
MQKMRTVVQERHCNCQNECNGGPTPDPLDGVNEVGEQCLKQGPANGDEQGVCRFLFWQTVREVDPAKIKIIG